MDQEMLIGAAMQFGDLASFIRVLSIGAFILLTTPVAAHVIARASYFADVPLWGGTVLDERRPAPTAPARTNGGSTRTRTNPEAAAGGTPRPERDLASG